MLIVFNNPMHFVFFCFRFFSQKLSMCFFNQSWYIIDLWQLNYYFEILRQIIEYSDRCVGKEQLILKKQIIDNIIMALCNIYYKISINLPKSQNLFVLERKDMYLHKRWIIQQEYLFNLLKFIMDHQVESSGNT